MNIKSLTQSMLKRAGRSVLFNPVNMLRPSPPTVVGSYEPGRTQPFIADSKSRAQGNIAKPVDHSRVYTHVAQLPEGERMPNRTDQPLGVPMGEFLRQSLSGFMQREVTEKPHTRGYTKYKVRYDTKDKPTASYHYASPGTDGFSDDDVRYIKVDPTRLPNYRNGVQLLAPSVIKHALTQPKTYGIKSADGAWFSPKKDLTVENVPFTEQPFTNAQIHAMSSGDPNYLKALQAHYETVPQDAWDKANLQLSPREERVAWEQDIPQVSPEASVLGIGYDMESGQLKMPPEFLTTMYNTWPSIENKGWNHYTTNESFGDQAMLVPSYPGVVSDMFNHENRHRSTLGQVTLVGYPYASAYNSGYDPNKPISESNMPTLMRQRAWYPFLQDAQQLEWTKEHAIQPYAVAEPEINQALMAMNEGRYRLKRDMQADSNNSNYQQIKPEVRQKLQELPDFIAPGEAGKQQLEELMQLFTQNPELRALMPEQSRLVGYYQNLKAAVETAETAEERAYFQNLMNRFIYNKAFLANNQRRSGMPYMDVQRMRA